jgi:hypothetical protein
VVLAVPPPVPDEVARVVRAIEDLLHSCLVPHLTPRPRDATPVQVARQGAERLAVVGVGPEEPADDLDLGGVAGNQALGLHPVSVGHLPAAPLAPPRRRQRAPEGVARQVAEECVLALLLHRVQDAAGEVLPVDPALGDRGQVYARVAEGLNPVAGLQRVEPAEAVLVPAQDGLKVAALPGVGQHLLKAGPPLGVVAGYRFIKVLAQDGVALAAGVSFHLFALLRDRLLLAAVAHAVIRHRPDRMALGHDEPPLQGRCVQAGRDAANTPAGRLHSTDFRWPG